MGRPWRPLEMATSAWSAHWAASPAHEARPHSRHAYILHVVEGCAGYEYSERNWLQYPEGKPGEGFAGI